MKDYEISKLPPNWHDKFMLFMRAYFPNETRAGAGTIALLAKYLKTDNGSASRVVSKLEQFGMVKKGTTYGRLKPSKKAMGIYNKLSK